MRIKDFVGLKSLSSSVKSIVGGSVATVVGGAISSFLGGEAESEEARTSEKGFAKAQGFAPTPYYIYVDIGGVKFSTEDGDTINFTTQEDFINNDYPIRVLTITTRFNKYHKVLQADKREVGEYKRGIDVLITSSTKSNDNLIENVPFLNGWYVGLLRESEVFKRQADAFNDETIKTMGLNAPEQFKKFTLYLNHSSELMFNSAKPNMMHITKNPTLMELFTSSFTEANPNMKFVVSPFDHNPKLGRFPLPALTFKDVIKHLETEVGFYRTNYFYYIYKGLFCFLNTANDHNVIVQELNNTFTIYPVRPPYQHGGYKIVKVSDRSFGISCNAYDLNIYIDNTKLFKTSGSYIDALGKPSEERQSTSRGTKSVLKMTTVPNIIKDPGLTYEIIEVKIDNFVDSGFSPFTVILYTDSNDTLRKYRLMSVDTTIVSGSVSRTFLKGFRVESEENTPANTEEPLTKADSKDVGASKAIKGVRAKRNANKAAINKKLRGR